MSKNPFMVKILDDDIKNEKKLETENVDDEESIILPIPIPDENTLYHKFRGNLIVIYDSQIVAKDTSLEQLYKKIEKVIPKGKRCRIRYIEKGIAIYGFDI